MPCRILRGLKNGAICSSETSISAYIAEDQNLKYPHRENVKTYTKKKIVIS
jgi:hypothetical protein